MPTMTTRNIITRVWDRLEASGVFMNLAMGRWFVGARNSGRNDLYCTGP